MFFKIDNSVIFKVILMVKPLSYKKKSSTNYINLKLGNTEINKDQKGDRKKKDKKKREEDQSSVRDGKFLTF